MAAEATALRPKQQHPRWQIPATRPVRVELGPAGAGSLIEISAGGMRIRSLAPMRRGAEVPIKIQIPDRPDVVRCYGIVVWSSSVSGATGVRFVNIPDSDKQLLATWLVELQKATKGPEELDVRLEGERALKEIRAQKLNSADALNAIARRAMEMSAGSGAMIALGSQMNMTCMASAGAGMEVGSQVMSSGGITGECTRGRKLVHYPNAENDPRVSRELKVGSIIALPLLVSGELRGVMEVFASKPFTFTPKIVEGLQALADAILKTAFAGPQESELPDSKPMQPVVLAKSQPSPNAGSNPIAPIRVMPSRQGESADTKPAEQFVVMKPQASPRIVNKPIAPVPVTSIGSPAPVKTDFKAVPIGATTTPPKSTAPAIAPTPVQPRPVAAEQPMVSVAPEGQDPGLEPLAGSITPASPLPNQTVANTRSSFVLELPENEGFDPTGKLAVRGLAAEPEPYSPPSSNRKWIFAVPVAAALIAVPFWYSRQQKAEPAVAAAAAPAEIARPVAEPVIEARPQETAAPVHVTQQQKSPTLEAVEVKAAQHEAREKTTIAAEKAKPEPEPIMLAAASSVAPRRHADDSEPTIAPNVPVSAVSVPAVPLPASARVPELQAPVITGGTLVKRVTPVYPPNARTMRTEGEVELLLQVNTDGTVGKIRTIKGNPMLAAAAIDAVKQWRYEPLRVNGTPKTTEKTIQLNFVLPR